MKILFTVEFYEPHKGGAEEVIKQLGERLVKKGHSVVVATSFLGERNFLELNGVMVETFRISGNSVNGIRGEEKEIERYQKFLLQSFDIIINYAAQIWTTDLAFDVLGAISAKKIFVPCGYSGLKNAKYKKYFEELPKFLEKYDSLVYLSPHYQDKVFGDKRGFWAKGIVVPNGASAEEFLPEDMFHIREKLKIKTPHILITVANHYVAKGHHFVINAFNKIKRNDVTLLIIGEKIVSSGTRKYYHLLFDYLHCLISAVFNKKIRIISGENRALVISAYKNADAFLFGSIVECAPLVMYESFAAKTPFISTRAGNVGDYEAYVKIVKTPEEMAEVAREFLENPEKKMIFAENAFILWKENYTWDIIVDQYEKLLVSLCRK